MRFTDNDVMDYMSFYKGVNESPEFYKQIINPKGKLFVPADDLALTCLCHDSKSEAILHYFVKDNRQTRQTITKSPPIELYEKYYAVCSKDLSVDSKNNFDCFNNSNILKSRIDTNRLQTQYGLLVILTLIWGDETTYKYAFGNVEKGTVCAVSSQGISDTKIFCDGFTKAIEMIQPEYLCWYGNPNNYFDLIRSAYDEKKIILMQKRDELVRAKIGFHNNYLFLEEEFMTLPIPY